MKKHYVFKGWFLFVEIFANVKYFSVYALVQIHRGKNILWFYFIYLFLLELIRPSNSSRFKKNKKKKNKLKNKNNPTFSYIL